MWKERSSEYKKYAGKKKMCRQSEKKVGVFLCSETQSTQRRAI